MSDSQYFLPFVLVKQCGKEERERRSWIANAPNLIEQVVLS